jgi:hypothetical protein
MRFLACDAVFVARSGRSKSTRPVRPASVAALRISAVRMRPGRCVRCARALNSSTAVCAWASFRSAGKARHEASSGDRKPSPRTLGRHRPCPKRLPPRPTQMTAATAAAAVTIAVTSRCRWRRRWLPAGHTPLSRALCTTEGRTRRRDGSRCRGHFSLAPLQGLAT